MFSTAPYWRVGEENHYWRQQFTYHNAFGQFLSEDDATGSATELYQQDLRDQVAAIQRQNAAMLVNDFTPVGVGLGLYNLGIKTIGGAASTLPLLFGRMDTARAWQDYINQAQIHLPSAAGELMRPGVNQLRSLSERHLGDGASTVLGAGLELTGDLLVMVPGVRALRTGAAEIGVLNRPLQSPVYFDLQGASAAYSGIPIALRSPFVAPSYGRFGTAQEFADAAFGRYQQFVDEGYDLALAAESRGRLSGAPNTRVGNYVDRYSRDAFNEWLEANGIAEGVSSSVQMNRWLRDPFGSGAYSRPDIRIPDANLILDATVGWKWSGTPQISNFQTFSSGNRIIIVRPTQLGGSYSIVQ